jgi:hypothetical protein
MRSIVDISMSGEYGPQNRRIHGTTGTMASMDLINFRQGNRRFGPDGEKDHITVGKQQVTTQESASDSPFVRQAADFGLGTLSQLSRWSWFA